MQPPAHPHKLYLLPQISRGSPCPPSPCSPAALLSPVPGLPPQPPLPLWPFQDSSLQPSSSPHSFISWAQLSSLDLPGAPVASGKLSPRGALSTWAPPGGGPALALRSSLSLHPRPPLAPCCLQFSGHLPSAWLPLLVLGLHALVSPLHPGGLRAQPCAARHGHRARPARSLVPGSATALGPSPVRTHSHHTWPCTGTHAGSTGLSRSLRCPGVLSLPCVLTSDSPSIPACRPARPALASRAPGHAQPSLPVPQPVLLLDGLAAPRPSQPQAAVLLVQCTLPGFHPRVPSPHSSHTVTRGSCLPWAQLGCFSPSGGPEAGLPAGLSFLCSLILGAPTHPWWGRGKGFPAAPGSGPLTCSGPRHMWLLESVHCVCNHAP